MEGKSPVKGTISKFCTSAPEIPTIHLLGKNIMHALHELHLLLVMSCQYEYVLHLFIPETFFLSQVSLFV